MTFDLEVDADAVRGCASALADTAAEVTSGSAPPPAPTMPRWESSAAAEGLSQAFHRVLTTEAAGVESFRLAVLAAIADYQSSDDRAADRLGRGR
jgi:hypothetical protein